MKWVRLFMKGLFTHMQRAKLLEAKSPWIAPTALHSPYNQWAAGTMDTAICKIYLGGFKFCLFHANICASETVLSVSFPYLNSKTQTPRRRFNMPMRHVKPEGACGYTVQVPQSLHARGPLCSLKASLPCLPSLCSGSSPYCLFSPCWFPAYQPKSLCLSLLSSSDLSGCLPWEVSGTQGEGNRT